MRLAWKEKTSWVGEGGQERVGLPSGGTGAPRGREEGAPRGAGPGRERRRYRLGMASSAVTLTDTVTGAPARALGIGRPARGGEKLPGSVNRRAVGEGAGDTGRRARRTGGRRYLCQGELGRRSHGVSIMHGRGRKDGRTGARGGEEAEGAAGGEARAGWRASPLTSTTSLLSSTPPRLAPPARHRPRRRPNPGAGVLAAGSEPAPGPPEKTRRGQVIKVDGLWRQRQLQMVLRT